MARHHPPLPGLPRQWLLSDARAAADPVQLAALLPPGSGIVLRHDDLASGVRWRLLRRLIRTARARRLIVLLAGTPAMARRWGADGIHLRQPFAHRAVQAHRLGLLLTMPVHDAREAHRARQLQVDGAFISPLHPTRSHPGAPALGKAAWLRLARQAGGRAIALGGMTPARARALNRASRSGHAWAAIDAWTGKYEKRAAKRQARQNRNAVPT